MMLLWFWAGIALAAPCWPQPVSNPIFHVTAPAHHEKVRLVLEIWPTPDTLPWAAELAAVTRSRDISVTWAIPFDPSNLVDPAILAFLGELQPYESVAIKFSPHQLPSDTHQRDPTIRRVRQQLKSIVKRCVVAVTHQATPTEEAALARSGFRTILSQSKTGTATPRPQNLPDGFPLPGVVLPQGPYTDLCQYSPRGTPLSGLSLDRTTQAIYGASKRPGISMVRLILDGHSGTPQDAILLAKWLDEVLLPASIRPISPRQVTKDVVDMFQNGHPSEYDPHLIVSGRLIPSGVLRESAEALKTASAIPALLPGNLTPEEAFVAFAKHIAGDTEGTVVRISPIKRPSQSVTSTLSGPTQFSIALIEDTAASLLNGLPDHVPSAIPIGQELLTASELLLLFASAVREDPSPTTYPISDRTPSLSGW